MSSKGVPREKEKDGKKPPPEVNDAPKLDLNTETSGTSTSISYNIGSPLTKIAPSAMVSDADSANFDGGYLRVGFSFGGTWTDRLGIVSDDRVSIKTGDFGLIKQIKVDGKDIGWAVGGSYGVDLVIVFNKHATPDRVETLLEHIGYTNVSDDPSTLTRNVKFTLVDGDGTSHGGSDSSSAMAKINFAPPANVAPVLTGDLSAAVAEGGSYVLKSSDLWFRDPDDVASGVTFKVSDVANGTVKVNGVAATSFTGQQLLDGLVRFEHNGSETTAASFKVVVEDGNEDGSAPTPATFKVTVSPVNDAPVVACDLAADVAKGGSYTLTPDDLWFLDPDDGPNDVTFTAFNVLNGTMKVNGVASNSFTAQQLQEGRVTFQHDGSPSATASFQVVVEDGNEDGSAPAPATFNITVSSVNAPPVLTGDLSATVAEGGVYTMTLADLGWNDADDNASGVTFSISNQVNGSLRVNGAAATSFTGEQLQNGLVTFQHNGSETTAASFQVSVEDGNEDASAPVASTFNFAVTPVNDAPVLTGDLSATVLEGGSYTLAAADLGWSDVDDNAAGVTFTVSNLVNGTLRVNGAAATSFTGQQLQSGQVTFQHNGSETTAASFEVSVDDGNEDGSASVAGTFNFAVTPVNDAPVLTGDLTASVAEGGSHTLTSADLGWSDVDDNAAGVTFTISNLVNGTLRVNGAVATSFTGQQLQNGAVTFEHNGSETASASFQVRVEDGNEDGSAPVASTFNFTVTAVNDAPVLTGDLSASMMEGGSYTLTSADLGWSDVDDNAAGVTFTVSNLVNGTLRVNGAAATSFTGQQLQSGQVTFQHNGSETTAASFQVSVEDGNEDGSAPVASTFNFTVTPVNDAPVLTGDLSASVMEGGSYTLTSADLDWSDVDDNASGVTFSISNQANGTLKVNGAAATSFTGQQLQNGLVTFEHNGSETASASFQVSVDDGNEDGSAPVASTFNFAVTPVNAPPVLTGDLSATVAEGGVYTMTLADLGWNDVDDNASGVTFSISSQVNGTLRVNGVAATSFTGQQLSSGLVTFEHNGSETTSASFQVSVEDGDEDGSAQVASTFNFTVTPVNDAPALSGDLSATVLEGGSYTLTLADLGWSDADDNASGVTFTISNLANGTLRVNGAVATSFTGQQLQNGLVTFQHNGSETTTASFQASVEDGNEDGSAAVASTFNFTVTPVNDAPVLTGDLAASVAEGGSYMLTLADLNWSDVDDNAAGVTFTISSLVNGTLRVNGAVATSFTGQQLQSGLVTFQHNGSETTTASFQVSVDDGNEDGSAPVTATFNFAVTPVNDAPVLTGDLSANVLEGGSYTLTLADLGWNDVDDNAAGVTFTISSLVNGTLRVNGAVATSFTGQQLQNGLVTFQHNGSETTTASFQASVEDGNEDGSAPVASTFNFTVTPVNDAPVLTGDLSATVLEGGAYTLTLADLGWSDVDDNASGVTFSISNLVNGTLRVNGAVATSFTGQQLQSGLVTFQHNGSETTSASFQVLVDDGNEDGSAPVAATFNFTVTPVNDAPVLTGDLSASVLEGGSYAITAVDLGWSDVDDNASGVTFTISNPLNGTVRVSGAAATTFTGQQLLNGLVTFEHNGSETASASFLVSVDDGNEDGSAPTVGTFTFAVTPVNDAPVLTGDLAATVLEGGSYVVTAADLGWSDPDDGASDVTFTVSSLVSGMLKVNGAAASSFTGQQLLNGLVVFEHDGSETSSASFQVFVEDGNEDGSPASPSAFTFGVTPVNDAPVLGGDLSASMLEGGSYTLAAADLGWSDPDDSASGVAFTVSSPLNGALRVNGVAATSFTGQQLLDGLVTFAHDGSETASASFQVSVDDGNEDGSAPVASTFNFAVTPVNDAPVLGGDLSATVLEGGTYALTAADLGWSDPDDSASDVTFTVSNPLNGALKVNGAAATSFSGQQLLAGLVTFEHDGSETTAASFVVLVEDGNEDGSAPISGTFSFDVTPVNDAPILTGDLSATMDEGAIYTLTTADLGWNDPDNSASDVMFMVANPVNGTLRVNGVATGTFTGQDLLDGLVSFTHDGSETTAASLEVMVEDNNEDGSEPVVSTLNFSVTPVNDAPVLTGDLMATILTGGYLRLTTGDLGWTDPDDSASEVTFSIGNLLNGILMVDGLAATTFTGAQLLAGLVRFHHDGSASTTASFNVSVEDGNEDGSVPILSTLLFNVVSPNIDLSNLSPSNGFIIQGDAGGDNAGWSVSSAGDVNGDGIDDIIVGVPGGNAGGFDSGQAYIIFGKTGGFGAVLDLTGLSAASGVVLRGDDNFDKAGFSVSYAGDVNGDGIDDVIIGNNAGDDAHANSGEAYVVFGQSFASGSIDLGALGSAGFKIMGDSADDWAGYKVSSAGDFNGDGYDDIIVGAPQGDDGGNNAGEAYLIYGRASGFGTIDLTSLTPAAGFVIQGDVAFDQLGRSSSAGDVNGDGYDDIIVGAPFGDNGGTDAGESYVIFGKASQPGTLVSGRQVLDLTAFSSNDGFIIQGDSVLDRSAMTVSAAGDVNGDGYDDVIVGAPNGGDGGTNAGEAYVVFGKSTQLAPFGDIDLTNLSAAQGFIIQGDVAGDQAGLSVAAAGDFNGDGYDDIIVGAPTGDNGGADAGEAYVVFGKASGFGNAVITAGVSRQVVDLTTLSFPNGFIIQGDAAGDYAGWSVSAAGDVNNDGFADLILGAPYGDNGGMDAGEAYIIFGAAYWGP